MLSVLIPLILFALFLFFGRQRALLRLSSADSWNEESLRAAIERVEAAAPAMFVEPSPVTIQTPKLPAGAPVRYLLDGDDPAPRPRDRVAELQHHMRGQGICSPR